MQIPVIDIFAGPGGLGEGFCAFQATPQRSRPFRIVLSIEKDFLAHKTLELRSFFRQFPSSGIPSEYYSYLRNELSREEMLNRYPLQANAAKEEAWHAELGKEPHEKVVLRIKNALKNSKKWVLIGGPPCQAYSVVGRSRMRNENPEAFEKDHRHFLYKEYLKIIHDHKPPVFVMENVIGILSSRVNGKYIIEKILSDLHCPSKAFHKEGNLRYHIHSLVKNRDETDPHDKRDYAIQCEKFGIPQRRHRVILLGIRADLKIKPGLLNESGSAVSLWDAIGDLPKLRSGITDSFDCDDNWRAALLEFKNYRWFRRKEVDKDFISYLTRQLKRIQYTLNLGDEYISHGKSPKIYRAWLVDKRLGGVCNHTARKHIRKDLHRYFYAICFAKQYSRSPEIKDFPRELWPNHENVELASSGNLFSDRFRVQLKNIPSTTVTSHISKDGHYFIHPDPAQCRSLTVREAARLQTFPDNYFFEGARTPQYGQVGNAVPPLLAAKIARIVYDVIQQID